MDLLHICHVDLNPSALVIPALIVKIAFYSSGIERLSIVEDEIRTLFEGKKPKQISLTAFVA